MSELYFSAPWWTTHATWGLIALGLALLLMVAIELRRPARYRALRMLGLALLLLGAFGLLARPGYHRAVPAPVVLWLTDSLAATQAQALADSLAADERWYALPPADTTEAAPLVLTAQGALARGPWQHLYVVGDGLPADVAPGLAAAGPWTHLPHPQQAGLLRVWARPEVQVGDGWALALAAQLPDSTLVRLVGPEGPVDSARVGEGERLRLSTRPRQAGALRYAVEYVPRPSDTVRHTVPLRVLPRQQLDIALLGSFPTFETQSLKNFLAAEGHRLSVRSQVSQGRYLTEFLNRAPRAVNTLTEGWLQELELIILTQEALQNLSARERARLRAAVVNQGLGVWLWAQPSAQPTGLPRDDARFFLPHQATRSTATELLLTADRWGLEGSAELPVPTYGWSAVDGRSLWETGGLTYTALHTRGLGQVGTSLLGETYRLLLAGHAQAYAAWWSHWLDATVGQRPTTDRWEGPELVRVGEVAPLTLTTAEAEPYATVQDPLGQRQPLALQQSALLAEQWQATLRPQEAGWHALETAADTTAWYVQPSQAWPASAQYARHQAWAHQALQATEPAASAATRTQAFVLSVWWWFAALLLGLTLLWVEPKF